MGRAEMLKTLKPELFANEKFGVITVKDITGRTRQTATAGFGCAFNDRGHRRPAGRHDPRGHRQQRGAVRRLRRPGRASDGLVHVSQLSHKFVNDARRSSRPATSIKMKVMEVDVARKRISLDEAGCRTGPARRPARENRFGGRARPATTARAATARCPQPAGQMASAFAKLQELRK